MGSLISFWGRVISILTTDERHEWSREIPLSDSSHMTRELIDRWNSIKFEGKVPLKSSMQPWDFKKHLGNICILDVVEKPLNFIYRLSGTFIDAVSEESLIGESILKAAPEAYAKVAYMDFRDSHSRAEPVLWLVEIRNGPDSQYTRLILPLSNNGDSVDYLMTYSFCVDSTKGHFSIRPPDGQSANIFAWSIHM